MEKKKEVAKAETFSTTMTSEELRAASTDSKKKIDEVFPLDQLITSGGKTLRRKVGLRCNRGHTITDYGDSECKSKNPDGTYGVNPKIVKIEHSDPTRRRVVSQCPKCQHTSPIGGN